MAAMRRIELLGGLRVIDGDREITHFVTQKTGALLAYLAYHRTQAHLRDTVIEMLWPWATPGAGRQSLSTALSALRHQLEPAGIPSGSVLLADRNTVGLNPETTITDIQEFEQALAEADRADPTLRIQHLETATALYRGDLLIGFYEAWIPPEAERLAEMFMAAISELSATLADRGEMELAATNLERAIETAPRREELYRQLMRLYSALGDPHLALDLYAELEASLRKGRRMTPSAATQELAAELRRGVLARPMATAARRRIIDRRAQRGAPAALPSGAVTFIAIRTPDGSPPIHDLPCEEEIRRHGGVKVTELGDTALQVVAFSHAGDALNCIAACRLRAERAPSAPAPPPAMAVHTCDAEVGAGGRYPQGALEHVLRLARASNPGQILYSPGAAAVIRHGLGGGFRLRELGSYRLPGCTAPEFLYQIEYPGGPGTLPPLDAEPAYTGHLPLRLTRFFGRGGELLQIEALLTSGARLVTLVGAPGCGKTRLALEAAQRMVETFAGRVWFVRLAHLQEHGHFLDHVLNALAISPSRTISSLDRIVQELEAYPALIVLDNFEHLLEAATEVSVLLERLPALRCLVTSRRRLNLPEEECFGVYPLPTPMDSSMKTLSANECIQLFVDRAQVVAPDFALTADNAETVADICARLDGIPLAIELAAGRLNVLSPGQILERLDPGTLLSSRIRDEDTRHRTLRAALDWSYSLLDAELQRFLAQLSVFSGGWTAAAAEAICDQPLAEDLLSELSAWSLVVFREADEAGGAAALLEAAPRFEMYRSIQEFAREKLRALGADLERRTKEQHGRWYAQYGTEEAITALDLHGGAERRRELGRELENLVTACRRAVRRGDKDIAAGTYAAAATVLLLRGPFKRAIALGELVASLPPDDAQGASVLRYLGIAELRSGEHEMASTHFELGLTLARRAGRRREEAMMLACLYSLFREQNRAQEAHAHIESALKIAREIGDRINEGIFLGNMGALAYHVGNPREAEPYVKEAIAIHREVGNRGQEGLSLGNLGVICRELGRTAEAKALYDAALEIHREVGNRRMEGVLLNYMGNLRRSQGRRDESRTLLGDALRIHREVGNRHYEAVTLNLLGNLDREQGRVTDAISLYDKALVIAREVGDQRLEGLILGNLGISHQFEGQMGEAESYCQSSIALLRETGDRMAEVRATHNLARLHLDQNRLDEAESLLESALALVRAAGSHRSEGFILDSLASVLMAKGLTRKAREALVRGEDVLLSLGNPWELASLLCTRAELEVMTGNAAAAAEALERAEHLAAQAGAGPESELARRLATARESFPT